MAQAVQAAQPARGQRSTHACPCPYAEQEGGRRTQLKGHTGFQKPQFELSGSFSLDDKRAKLQALKARTTCRRCGAIGHWSGDANCPLQKRKGKKSSGKGAYEHHEHYQPPCKGEDTKGQKTRMVYFSISETAPTGAPQAHLALRRDPPPQPERQALPAQPEHQSW